MEDMGIGTRIADYRKRLGITQEELGRAAGVSTQAVSRWECGGTPDVALLPAIADRLGVSVDALFGRGGSAAEVLEDLTRLQSRCKLLIAVTIGGLSPEGYDGETAEYIDALNGLNDALFARASGAARMQDHQPLWKKGGLHGLA